MIGIYQGVGANLKRLRSDLKCTKSGHDIFGTANSEHIHLKAKLASNCLNLRDLFYRSGIANIGDDREVTQIRGSNSRDFNCYRPDRAFGWRGQ